jgi:hypothetical protein
MPANGLRFAPQLTSITKMLDKLDCEEYVLRQFWGCNRLHFGLEDYQALQAQRANQLQPAVASAGGEVSG